MIFDTLEHPKPTEVSVSSDVTDWETRYTMNGEDVTKEDIAQDDRKYLKELEAFSERESAVQQITLWFALRIIGVDIDAKIPRENNAFTVSLTEAQIEKLRGVLPAGRAHFDLKGAMSVDIDDAVQWSGINEHARFGTHRGSNVGIWQTEPSCAPNNWALIGNISTPYTGPASANSNIRHAENMAMVMRSVSPLAFIQCTQSGLPTAAQANNTNPTIEVSSRSASFNFPNGNYSMSDAIADDNIARSLVPHVNSAGNISSIDSTPNVRSGARALNVLTVGNIDIDTIPATPFSTTKWVNSNLLNEKPEISAPGAGTNLPGLNRSTGGTSAATAHTAGFIANLISNDASLRRRPMAVKALLMAGATNFVNSNRSRIGLGGINYRDTSQFYHARHWRSSTPPRQLDFVIPMDINKPNIRVVLAWLNSGAYALVTGTLSLDFDLQVLDPNNVVIASSASHMDPFEDVNFKIRESGNYTYRVTLFAQQNRLYNAEIGLVVNSDD